MKACSGNHGVGAPAGTGNTCKARAGAAVGCGADAEDDGDDGIECDEDGEVVAYRILKRDPGDNRSYAAPLNPDRIPAKNVLHWFVPDRPGQLRGIPDITPALPLFAQQTLTTTFAGGAHGYSQYFDLTVRPSAITLVGLDVAVAFHQQLEDAMTTEQPLLTFDAIQPAAGGGASDGWLAVWPRP